MWERETDFLRASQLSSKIVRENDPPIVRERDRIEQLKRFGLRAAFYSLKRVKKLLLTDFDFLGRFVPHNCPNCEGEIEALTLTSLTIFRPNCEGERLSLITTFTMTS